MGKSKIEWTDETWNPVRGCSRVSDGCRNCYAEKVAHRFSGLGQPYEGLIASGGQWNGEIRFVPEKLREPLHWRKPRMVFVNSMSDLFHENVPDDWIDQIFAVMAACPQHTFQVLTKRPERMQSYICSGWQAGMPPNFRRIGRDSFGSLEGMRGTCLSTTNGSLANVWLGVSVEDQQRADERIPLLLQTPAAIRWISAEPLLGPINLDHIRIPHGVVEINGGRLPALDWVVVGGESGPGARPMHPDWVRSLRDQCRQAGVSFFFKQWGEWLPRDQGDWHEIGRRTRFPRHTFDDAQHTFRVGKRSAGAMLDGEEIREWPA